MLVAPLLSACSGGASGRTVITFFQFKPEAQAYFQDLAQQFEEANPNVRVVVDNPADPETALRTRLVKNDVPDVMTLNANGTFGEFASAKIFRDFQDDPSLDDVNPAYLKVIGALGAGGKGEVNGVPFAANASGLLYNEDLFAKHDVAVPKTFDELIAAAKKFKDAGVTPFYGMLADAWTAQSPLGPAVVAAAAGRLLPAALRRQDHVRQGLAGDRRRARGAVQVHPARPPVEGLRGRHRRIRQGRVGDAAARQLRGPADPGRQAEVHRREHGAARDQRPGQDDPGLRRRRGHHGREER